MSTLKALRRPWRGRLLLILTAILAIGVIAAACGGDDDDADPLKIGFLADFSGPLAEFGPVIQTGVELAITHINAAGGVNGSDVTFVTGDSAVDPNQGVAEARRLVEVEGVTAIVGPLSSGVAIAVAESVTGAAHRTESAWPALDPTTAPDRVFHGASAGVWLRRDSGRGPSSARASRPPWSR